MGNLKQTELQRTEERKAENRSEKDRTRRITKKLQEEKKRSGTRSENPHTHLGLDFIYTVEYCVSALGA